jgi:hypothetical protein
MAYVYTAIYSGGTYGSPSDYAVRCDADGNTQLQVASIHQNVLLVNSMAEAEQIADLLNRTRAIVVPIR